MGDGNINSTNGSNPRLRVSSINKQYLNHLDNVFGVHSLGVNLKQSASESALRNRKTDFSPDAREENYSDLYELHTRNSPELNKFQGWYNDNGKTWPKVELNRTILKHLYCCDGSFNNRTRQVHISCSNERDEKDKVEEMFGSVGINVDSWNDKVRDVPGYEGSISTSLVINKSNIDNFFKYIGNPVSGFEYKWPEEYK